MTNKRHVAYCTLTACAGVSKNLAKVHDIKFPEEWQCAHAPQHTQGANHPQDLEAHNVSKGLIS